ncbi:MAG TPA: hypothetical protein VFX61_12980, partial [Micromonosporaceae bacterium]|nr:hypothetical protein [Micromonosporaceae bacterium]
FKLDDLWALAKGAAEGKAGVASFAILKVYELIAELLTKAGLPSQSIAIDVDYHGADIVLAKGANSVNLILARLPKVHVDLVSCSGVKGPYKGTGGFDGAEMNEFYRQAWASVFGVHAPAKTPAQGTNLVPVQVDDNGRPHTFLIMKGEGGKQFLDGQITIYPAERRDSPILANKIAYYDGWKVGRPVGEVEILLAGNSFPFSDLSWPVLRVKEDPRCPKVEYRYDNL